MRDRLQALATGMASDGADLRAQKVDDQARGALRCLVERAVQIAEFPGPIAFEQRRCPNCGGSTSSTRSPYCSESCRCEAAFVRQFRAAVGDDKGLDSARQIALGENLWMILGGLYPRRQALVLDRVMKRVNKRSNGLCEVCLAPASTVDHIGSG